MNENSSASLVGDRAMLSTRVNIPRRSSSAKEDERIQKRDSTGWIPRWLIRQGGSLTSRRECTERLTPITWAPEIKVVALLPEDVRRRRRHRVSRLGSL